MGSATTGAEMPSRSENGSRFDDLSAGKTMKVIPERSSSIVKTAEPSGPRGTKPQDRASGRTGRVAPEILHERNKTTDGRAGHEARMVNGGSATRSKDAGGRSNKLYSREGRMHRENRHRDGSERHQNGHRWYQSGMTNDHEKEEEETSTSEGSAADVAEDGDNGESDEATRCPCGRTESIGFMIACEKCKTWQHGKCMGIRRESEAPDEYYCHKCRPDLVRKGCLAHPRFKERKATKENRAKENEAFLSTIKPSELRKMISSDLRDKRRGERVDIDETFRVYASRLRTHFMKDKDSLVLGVSRLTGLEKNEVIERLDAAGEELKKEAKANTSAFRSESIMRSPPREKFLDGGVSPLKSGDFKREISMTGDGHVGKQPRTPNSISKSSKSPGIRKRPQGGEDGGAHSSSGLSREEKKAQQLYALFQRMEERAKKKVRPEESPTYRPKQDSSPKESPKAELRTPEALEARYDSEQAIEETSMSKNREELKDNLPNSRPASENIRASGRKLNKDKDRRAKGNKQTHCERKRVRAIDVALSFIDVPQDCNGTFFSHGPSVVGSGMRAPWLRDDGSRRSKKEMPWCSKHWVRTPLAHERTESCKTTWAGLPWKKRLFKANGLKPGHSSFTNLHSSQGNSPSSECDLPPLTLAPSTGIGKKSEQVVEMEMISHHKEDSPKFNERVVDTEPNTSDEERKQPEEAVFAEQKAQPTVVQLSKKDELSHKSVDHASEAIKAESVQMSGNSDSSGGKDVNHDEEEKGERPAESDRSTEKEPAFEISRGDHAMGKKEADLGPRNKPKIEPVLELAQPETRHTSTSLAKGSTSAKAKKEEVPPVTEAVTEIPESRSSAIEKLKDGGALPENESALQGREFQMAAEIEDITESRRNAVHEVSSSLLDSVESRNEKGRTTPTMASSAAESPSESDTKRDKSSPRWNNETVSAKAENMGVRKISETQLDTKDQIATIHSIGQNEESASLSLETKSKEADSLKDSKGPVADEHTPRDKLGLKTACKTSFWRKRPPISLDIEGLPNDDLLPGKSSTAVSKSGLSNPRSPEMNTSDSSKHHRLAKRLKQLKAWTLEDDLRDSEIKSTPYQDVVRMRMNAYLQAQESSSGTDAVKSTSVKTPDLQKIGSQKSRKPTGDFMNSPRLFYNSQPSPQMSTGSYRCHISESHFPNSATRGSEKEPWSARANWEGAANGQKRREDLYRDVGKGERARQSPVVPTVLNPGTPPVFNGRFPEPIYGENSGTHGCGSSTPVKFDLREFRGRQFPVSSPETMSGHAPMGSPPPPPPPPPPGGFPPPPQSPQRLGPGQMRGGNAGVPMPARPMSAPLRGSQTASSGRVGGIPLRGSPPSRV